MATLQDVAKRAGVSTATVSKVLSNTPYFTEATRSKVMRAVEELNYRPNLAARALAAGKTQIVAVVFPYVYDAIFTDPLILQILEGIEQVCTERGYNILLSTPRLREDGPDEHYLNLIQSGYIDGIIALDNVPIASVLEPVHEHGITCVAIGYHDTPYSVRSDDFAGGRKIMTHVLEQGHKDIGVINVGENMNYAINRRLDGMQAACEAANFDFESIHMAIGDFSVESGRHCAASLLEQTPSLSAIVCLNDRMAIGAIQQARILGRSVPESIAITGYDDIPTATIYSPSLTTVNQQAPAQGRAAAETLFEALNNNQPDPISLPTQLIIRESSAEIRL